MRAKPAGRTRGSTSGAGPRPPAWGCGLGAVLARWIVDRPVGPTGAVAALGATSVSCGASEGKRG